MPSDPLDDEEEAEVMHMNTCVLMREKNLARWILPCLNNTTSLWLSFGLLIIFLLIIHQCTNVIFPKQTLY